MNLRCPETPLNGSASFREQARLRTIALSPRIIDSLALLRTIVFDARRDLLDQCRVFQVVALAVNNLKAVSVVVLTSHFDTGGHWPFAQVYYSVQLTAVNIHGSKPLTDVNYFGFDVVHIYEVASSIPESISMNFVFLARMGR